MSHKIAIKHSKKNQPDNGELQLADSKGVRLPNSEWWTFAQFSALVPGFDEPKLRRLAIETNPASAAPWIPKPRAARVEFTPTLRGVIAYLLHQIEKRDTLPRQCSGMNVVAGIFGIPEKVQKHFKQNGLCPDAFEASNRVNTPPLIAAMGATLADIISAGTRVSGIPGFEQLDKDAMQARVLLQTEIEKTRENNLANGNLYTRETLEQILEPIANWSATWKHYEKDTGQRIKTLLATAGVSPEIIRQTITLATEGVIAPPLELRQRLKFDGNNWKKAK